MDVGSGFSIQVDARNPGQYFACCGLLELADAVSGCAMGWFNEESFCCETTVPLAEVVRPVMEEVDGSGRGKRMPFHCPPSA